MIQPLAQIDFLRDWFALLMHCLSLSPLTVGGALSIAPDLHRYLVEQQHWLSDTQFVAALALAQSAPGPNVLYVGLIGLQLGLNAGGLQLGLAAMLLTLGGVLAPSSVLTYIASRWAHVNAHLRTVRAFKQGMAPIVIGLLCASGWVTALANNGFDNAWPAWLMTLASAVLVLRTRLHLLVLIAAGAALGWFGLI